MSDTWSNLNFFLELTDIGIAKNLTLSKQLCKFKEFRMLVLEDSKELALPSQGIPLFSTEYTIFSHTPCPSRIPKSHTHYFSGLYFRRLGFLHHFQVRLFLCHFPQCHSFLSPTPRQLRNLWLRITAKTHKNTISKDLKTRSIF